ncbi:MAG: T9SS type A sorting domain-containing protein [Candidatus Zixiibacteriota bacterium]|nr:MAG: T9SS type A sorting domain-containing protein [candidate division Zixibacteria bacterium]
MRVVIIFMITILISNLKPSPAFGFTIDEIDISKPFPLSLLEYPVFDSPDDPWIILDVDNIRVNSDNSGQLQNEEMVCINPTNTANAVALWRDFRLGYRRVGVGYTLDAGQTWHDTLLVVPPHPRQSDPVLAVDDDGNYFACTLCLQWGSGPSGIYVQKSTDSGVTWGNPVAVVDSNPDFFEDKQWITIDRTFGSTNGNIYIPWARFDADFSQNQVVLSYSHDGGASYGGPVAVSDGRYIQWPTVTTGMSGEVIVAWYSGFPLGIYTDVSYDQGITFGTDSLVVPINTGSIEINGNILVFPFPALASDVKLTSPYLGNIYMVFMDFNVADMDIFFARSENTAGSWTTPIRINDDPLFNGADQFHPWITVDEAGIIHVIFYDRRLDNNNWLFDVFYTRSEDGGDTWTANERITDVSSDPSQAATAGLIGEYIGLSAWQGEVQMVWTDTRNGNQDVYAGRLRTTAIEGETASIPKNLRLGSPYPNPFNNSVNLLFYASAESYVELDVVDLLGRKIADIFKGKCRIGENRFSWNGVDLNGNDVSSGVYFVRLNARDKIETRKAVLLR